MLKGAKTHTHTHTQKHRTYHTHTQRNAKTASNLNWCWIETTSIKTVKENWWKSTKEGLKFVLCVLHASPTLLLDHAVSSDDVREREHICFCCYSNRMEKERGRERKEERRERRKKRVIRDRRGWGRNLPVISHASLQISHAPSYCTGCEGIQKSIKL